MCTNIHEKKGRVNWDKNLSLNVNHIEFPRGYKLGATLRTWEKENKKIKNIDKVI